MAVGVKPTLNEALENLRRLVETREKVVKLVDVIGREALEANRDHPSPGFVDKLFKAAGIVLDPMEVFKDFRDEQAKMALEDAAKVVRLILNQQAQIDALTRQPKLQKERAACREKLSRLREYRDVARGARGQKLAELERNRAKLLGSLAAKEKQLLLQDKAHREVIKPIDKEIERLHRVGRELEADRTLSQEKKQAFLDQTQQQVDDCHKKKDRALGALREHLSKLDEQIRELQEAIAREEALLSEFVQQIRAHEEDIGSQELRLGEIERELEEIAQILRPL